MPRPKGEPAPLRPLEEIHRDRYRFRMTHNLSTTILPGVVHGKRSSYSEGCRCDPCTDEEMLYSRKRSRNRIMNNGHKKDFAK